MEEPTIGEGGAVLPAGGKPAEEAEPAAKAPADDASEAGAEERSASRQPAAEARRERRARARDIRTQWRKGTRGGSVFVLERTIPEDPGARLASEVLPGVPPELWLEAAPIWAAADLALSATIAGRLLGARAVLVPTRGRFVFAAHVPGFGAFSDPRVRFRDPASCMAAARASFAATVVREAPLWREVESGRVDPDALRAAVRGNLERMLGDEEAGRGAA